MPATIESIHPIASREGEISKNSQTSTRQWLVLLIERNATEQEVLNAVGLPLIWASHPDDPASELSRLRAIQNQQEGHERSWVVSVSWSTGGPGAGTRNRQTPLDQRSSSPTERAAKIRARWEFMDFAAFVDREGYLILNSACDPYDPGLVIQEQILVLTVTKNVIIANFNLEDMNDSVNDLPITIPGYPQFGQDELWLTFEDAEKQRERSIEFFAVTAVFKCRRHFNVDVRSADNTQQSQVVFGGWQPKPLNCGFREGVLVNNVRKYRTFGDDKGVSSGKPKPLDANGARLPDNQVPLFGRRTPGVANLGTPFVMKKRKDHNTLGFF